MKTIQLFWALGLIASCSAEQPVERRQATGGVSAEVMPMSDLPANEMSEFEYNVGTGLNLAANPKAAGAQGTIEQGIAQLQAIAPTAKAGTITAIGFVKANKQKQIKCDFLKIRYLDAAGWHTESYAGSNQAVDCVEQAFGMPANPSLTGGYVAVLVKATNTSYAGAIGVGVVGVSPYGVAGCGVGAAGVASQEFSYAAGVAGGACGSIAFETPIGADH